MFEIGQKVRTKSNAVPFPGEVGTIVELPCGSGFYVLDMGEGRLYRYFELELELLQEQSIKVGNEVAILNDPEVVEKFQYCIGEVVQISDDNKEYYVLFNNRVTQIVLPQYLVLLLQEKFKVGDRVRVLNDPIVEGDHQKQAGKVVRVYNYDNPLKYEVKFDDGVNQTVYAKYVVREKESNTMHPFDSEKTGKVIGFILNKIDCIKLVRRLNPDDGLLAAKNLVDKFFAIYEISAVDNKNNYEDFLRLAVAIQQKSVVFDGNDITKIDKVTINKDNFNRYI
jgi:hypothetical protein